MASENWDLEGEPGSDWGGGNDCKVNRHKAAFHHKTLQTGRANVKALNSLEGEPTSALPNLSPTINRPKYRAARLCNDTVERS